MMTLVTGIIGIAMLMAFLGILLWWIKAVPLIIIVVAVVPCCLGLRPEPSLDDSRPGR